MKVAIVNDSKAAAEVLRRVLLTVPEFTLAWTAYSGEEALQLCAKSQPDIILMDLIMPGLDGAETTRLIMQSHPCVVLVVTATTTGNRDMVFEAMGHGALDAVNTPTLGMDGDMNGAEPLLQKLRTVARLVAPQRSRSSSGPVSQHRSSQIASSVHAEIPVIAIGASTGGPQAIAEILSRLPASLHAAVVIAQHVDEHFAPGLAEWLQRHTQLPVRIAQHGEAIHAGGVWIAGTSDHLCYVENNNGPARLTYVTEPVDTPYRPSVDVLFTSLARPHYAPRVGVLLTGMGRDGAEGLLALRQSGSLTIAQDAETSVVYGMPKAAATLNAATEVLPLEKIAQRICDAVSISALKEKP